MSPVDDSRGSATGEETRGALAEVLEDQAERRQRRRESRHPAGGRRRGLGVAAGVLAVVSAWLWLAPPAFVRPDPLSEPSPSDIEAGLRMQMAVVALGIDRFREEHGRLPADLAELPAEEDDLEDVTYHRVGEDAYRLEGSRGPVSVSWSSTTPLAELSGVARALMRTPEVAER